MLRDNSYKIAPLLETIFLSRDFYSPASVGTQIKSPVLLAISTFRKLGLTEVPGVPDFNVATGTQKKMVPYAKLADMSVARDALKLLAR